MRILYDSKLPQYKVPFGTLTPGQVCTLNVHVPASVLATSVTCILLYDDGRTPAQDIVFSRRENKGPYEIWTADCSIPYTGLFFYYFYIG